MLVQALATATVAVFAELTDMYAGEHTAQNCRSLWRGFSKNRSVVLSCYLFIGLALGGTYLWVTRPTSVNFTLQDWSSGHTTHEVSSPAISRLLQRTRSRLSRFLQRIYMDVQCDVAESPANRVCRFHNLLLFQGQLWYSYAGTVFCSIPLVETCKQPQQPNTR